MLTTKEKKIISKLNCLLIKKEINAYIKVLTKLFITQRRIISIIMQIIYKIVLSYPDSLKNT